VRVLRFTRIRDEIAELVDSIDIPHRSDVESTTGQLPVNITNQSLRFLLQQFDRQPAIPGNGISQLAVR